jgi:antitoxin MazE
MQVAKWGNSLAVRIPTEWVRKLGLKEGDPISLVEEKDGTVRLLTRQHWLNEIERLRRPLPADWKDWKTDRDRANLRGAEEADGNAAE